MWGAGGLLGGRLTADLVLRSPQGMNCLGDYELCLRGARAESKGSGMKRQRERW